MSRRTPRCRRPRHRTETAAARAIRAKPDPDRYYARPCRRHNRQCWHITEK